MITNNELNEARLSATKKDYYQIWNELLEISSKLSDIWTPKSTNESDPGIVLLKVLTGIADKLNYNIDKNILEAYMPSAAQRESMMKLCDMLGYNMKYYQSAMTTVTVAFKNSSENKWPEDTDSLFLPIFTTFSDTNDEIHYVTTRSATIQKLGSTEIPCIEGQLVQCTSENDNIISINQLDSNNRYYLPEAQIAENGIFIQNYDNGTWSEFWTKVNNLNDIQLAKKVYKFCYDSRLGYPYIQFPADVAQLIKDGLTIYYIRTHGSAGNISARMLTKFTKPSIWDENGYNLDIDTNFTVTNKSATLNGTNLETIEDAYNNFKKTIGTFDTLVTCRDYMNKIYQLTDDLNNPLVSNCIVSDIRDDINRARLICTYNSQGVCYIEDSLKDIDENTGKTTDKINNFELILYPFTAVSGYNVLQDYKNSFKLNTNTFNEIITDIKDIKTISHQIVAPNSENPDIAAIKVYLRLYISIITNNKVNVLEQKEIISNIKQALYNKFNLRQLDFGEEIPTEQILDTVQYADSRIKTIYLQKAPELIPKFMVADEKNNEYTTQSNVGKKLYNKTTLRNLLAGRVELFNYDPRFAYNFYESKYEYSSPIYPQPNTGKKIVSIKPSCVIPLVNLTESNPITLHANEVVKFRAPNLNTIITYPVYVNYYFKAGTQTSAIRANTDYKLKNGDILFINYTEKLADDTEEAVSVVKNICYEAGTIIRPNFDLYPLPATGGSKLIKKNEKFTVYDANNQPTSAREVIDSSQDKYIYTLDTNQQIEVRRLTKITLAASSGLYEKQPVYWTSQDFSEDLPWVQQGTANIYKYILNDGEYFYYTDTNKTDMAWFGSGTEITIHGVNPFNVLHKNDSESAIDPDKILENGLDAIPWKNITLSAESPEASIEIQEYQYINLVGGDKLLTLELSEGNTLTSSWNKVSSGANTKFILNNVQQSLPEIVIGDGIDWYARSVLDINVGPSTPQVLQAYSQAGSTPSNIIDRLEICYEDGSSDTLIPVNNLPLSFITNYVIQSNRDNIDVRVKSYDISTGETTDLNDFTIKTYYNNGFKVVKGSLSESLNSIIHNSGEKWTKLQFNDYGLDNPAYYIELSANLPNNSYGLVMLYNPVAHENKYDNPYLVFNTNDDESSAELELFNAENAINKEIDTDDKWWDDYKVEESDEPTKYYLHQGINIVKIPEAGTIKIYPDNTTSAGAVIGQSAIIISDLDVILITENDETGINNKLICYEKTSDLSATKQLLKDIPLVDIEHTFYYNCPINNSYAINFSDAYKLNSPEILFDKNNLNNKFVIAEIDPDYLDVGLTIDRASKL